MDKKYYSKCTTTRHFEWKIHFLQERGHSPPPVGRGTLHPHQAFWSTLHLSRITARFTPLLLLLLLKAPICY